MNQLSSDVSVNLFSRYYLEDFDALSLFKTCKHQYLKIQFYKYKGIIDYRFKNSYINCKITKIKNIIEVLISNTPNCNQPVTSFITHWYFCELFNQVITSQSLPNSLTHLTFGFKFDQPIIRNSLPNSLTHLRFGFGFNQFLISNSLPNSITHLTFGGCFNRLLSIDDLPNSITHLTFGHIFNQTIARDVLPKSITHLTFGDSFDQPINDNNLPQFMTHLKVGDHFVQSLRHLPDSITHLTLNYISVVTDFRNNEMSNIGRINCNFKNSITHLTIDYYLDMYDSIVCDFYNQLVHKLPKSVTCVTFKNWYSGKATEFLTQDYISNVLIEL